MWPYMIDQPQLFFTAFLFCLYSGQDVKQAALNSAVLLAIAVGVTEIYKQWTMFAAYMGWR